MNDAHHSIRKFSFSKRERLKKRTVIKTLFQIGKAFSFADFRVIYFAHHLKDVEAEKSISIGISVPKKYFKKAVDRNLIKRRMREQYRLQKYNLYDMMPKNTRLEFFLIYQSKVIHDSAYFKKQIFIIMQEILKRIST